jgi:hypothetical protein
MVERVRAAYPDVEVRRERAWCLNPDCGCVLNLAEPCEEFMEGEHHLGRCGRCGWLRPEHGGEGSDADG